MCNYTPEQVLDQPRPSTGPWGRQRGGVSRGAGSAEGRHSAASSDFRALTSVMEQILSICRQVLRNITCEMLKKRKKYLIKEQNPGKNLTLKGYPLNPVEQIQKPKDHKVKLLTWLPRKGVDLLTFDPGSAIYHNAVFQGIFSSDRASEPHLTKVFDAICNAGVCGGRRYLGK